MKTLFLVLMLVLGGLLLSCKSVAPKSYYLLEDQKLAVLAESAVATTLVGIGPIELAGYLDRPQVTYQQRAEGVELSAHHVWAEPLEQGVARMLASRIIAHAPARAVVYFPWRQDSRPANSVRVQVQGIVRDGDNLSLQATWVLLGANVPEPLQYHHFNRQLPLGTGGKSNVQPIVEAMGELLALLAEDINQQLDLVMAK